MRGNGPLGVQKCCSSKWRHAFVLFLILLSNGYINIHKALEEVVIWYWVRYRCHWVQSVAAEIKLPLLLQWLFRLTMLGGEFHHTSARNWDMLIRSAEVRANALAEVLQFRDSESQFLCTCGRQGLWDTSSFSECHIEERLCCSQSGLLVFLDTLS